MTHTFLFCDIPVVSTDETGKVGCRMHSWVAVKDGRIAAVSPTESAARSALGRDPDQVISGQNRLLLPALANTHNHMAMTLLRNAADDLPLHRWLFEAIFPREARLTSALVAAGSRLALSEMIRSGTGLSADMYYDHEETARAALDAGFRLNLSVDAKREGPDGQKHPDPDLLGRNLRQLGQHPSGLLRVSLLVHSVYLYEEALYPQLADMARQMDCPVQVHIAETEKEVADCLARYGRRPAAQLAHFGFFRTPTLAAHCVHLDEGERAVLANPLVLAAHCPASNLKLGSGLADVPAMLQSGVRVGIGTDGPASNNTLDLYRDMRLASFLAKGARQDASLLPAPQILAMTTFEGARARGFTDSGRIAPGWQADLQVVRTDSPGMTPLGDPVSALVYSAAGSDVESLMVAGRWLMEKRELKTLDEEKIRFEAVAAARALA